MSPRLLSRSLLSLLMVWQLLASVLAHPLPAAMSVHMDVDHAAAADDMADMMSSHCPHQHAQAAQSSHPVVADAGQKGPACHVACKCPCAGTPALTFVLPTVPAALTGHPLGSVDFQSVPFAPPTSLLRPPIA